jgi:hypothetical protein
MFDNFELKQIMNVLLAIVLSSCVIILVTINMTDKNGLSALLGGYSGVLLGMLFIMIVSLIFTKTTYLEMFPIVMIIITVGLLIAYLGIYFDKISKGEVSSYYSSFSYLSAIFLFTQIMIVFNAIYSKSEADPNKKLFKYTTISFLGLFSVINIMIVLTMGIILGFYSTQG